MEKILQTTDLKAVRFVADMICEAGEIGLVYGVPGTGKTESLRFAAERMLSEGSAAVVIEGFKQVNVLKELCTALGLDAQKTNELRFTAVRDCLKRSPVAVFVDEAENVSYAGLEWLRRLWDFCRIPLLLVGTETLYQNMQGAQGQRRQLYRRVRAKWHMQGLTSEELETVCREYGYEKPKNIAKMCGSNFDKAVNILEKMKRFAEKGGTDINALDVREVARFLILD